MRPHFYLLFGLGALALLLSAWFMDNHPSSAWVKTLCQAVNTPPQVALRSQVAGLLKARQFDQALLKSDRQRVVRAAFPVAPAQGTLRILAAIPWGIVEHLPEGTPLAYRSVEDEAIPALRQQPALPPPKPWVA